MASTNKTTNYELSQYIGTDKPTYLTDYNQDMAKIDAGIHAAKAEADSNATNIGDLTSLTTTAKTSAVTAINELDSDLGTLSTTVGNHTTAIADNTSHIGDLTNLTTSSKSNLVSAINEVDTNGDTNSSAIGTLSNLTTTAKSNLVSAINEVNEIGAYLSLTRYEDITFTYGLNNAKSIQLKLATNEAGTVFKLYGQPRIEPDITGQDLEFTGQTRLRPDSEYNITGFGLAVPNYENGITRPCNVTIKTTGEVVIKYYNDGQQSLTMFVPPCLYFNKDFGDTTNQN